MAKKLSTEDVKKWQARIEFSRKWRKPYEDKWKRYIEYLEGIYYDTPDDSDQIAVNLVFPMVRVIIPSIYSKNPDVLVYSRRGDELKDQADAMAKYLRYTVKEMELKEEIKLCILDAICTGHGWMKQGFDTYFEGGDYEKDPTSIGEKVVSFVKSVLGAEDYESTEEDYAIRPNEKIVAEKPWALRVSPFNMFLPAYWTNLKTVPWLAEQIIMPLQDVKDNPRFKNTKDLKPSSGVRELLTNSPITANSADGTDEEYVILYEVWDRRENCIHVLAKDHEKELDYKENEYDMLDSTLPYTMLRFNETPDKIYPQSDIEPIEPQLRELNKIRTQMSNHRKRFNRRYLYKEGAFTDESIAKLESGEDGTMAPVEGEENIDAAFKPVQDAPLSNDVYQGEIRVKDDITNISGITDYQRGSIAQGAKTATEASIVEGQSRNRTEERLDCVNTFALRIIRNLAMMSQKFLEVEDVIPILGEEQAVTGWMKLDRDTIQGEFLYEIVYGSTVPISKEVERNQFLQLYGLTNQDPMFNQIRLREELLRQFDKRDVKAFLNPIVVQQLDAMGGSNPMPPEVEAGGGGGPAPPEPSPIAIGPSPVTPSSIRASIKNKSAVKVPGGAP